MNWYALNTWNVSTEFSDKIDHSSGEADKIIHIGQIPIGIQSKLLQKQTIFGKPLHSKMDEILEKYQTVFDPTPHFLGGNGEDFFGNIGVFLRLASFPGQMEAQ